MNLQLLNLLNNNARLSDEEIAVMTGLSVEETREEISKMTREGIIRGYKTVIDWERLDNKYVSAIIELKVMPKPGLGFDELAKQIMKYKEVESIYLMSGAYDLSVVVKCKTFHEVAMFVAKELSTLENVTSTSTHFVLRRYKELDVELTGDSIDDRGHYSF